LTLAVVLVVGGGVAFALSRHSGPMVTGATLDRAVPSLPLISSTGAPTSLDAFRGKVVVLAPFLTLCAEVCPITEGAFIQMRAAVHAAGLDDRVAFVEVTIDPERDTPARLRAFQRLIGANWSMFTGTTVEVSAFWKYFGVGYFKTPQRNPPATDWWTHRPETYDVAHSDGLFFLDERGHERIVIVGMPTTGGQLSPALVKLLSAEGRRNLEHPQAAWTVPQALGDLGSLLGRKINVDDGSA